MSNLVECVVDQYNTKHATGDNKVVQPLVAEDFHLELDDGKELLVDAKVNECKRFGRLISKTESEDCGRS